MASPVVEYYTDTGLDYEVWSPEFNMHFGCWRPGLNPFSREPMLDEMNFQVARRLHLTHEPREVVDMGCGLGATMRTIARIYNGAKVVGVTLVPWQVEHGRSLNESYGDRLQIRQANYMDTGLPPGCADAAYALESCCHAPGEDKGDFLEEMHRLLKPGGRFVVVDGFTTSESARRPALFRRLVDMSCQGWALPCFPSRAPFLEKLETLGFEELEVKDLSWSIAPTVLHSPILVVTFTLKKMLEGERLNRTRWNHLKSCFVSLGVGLYRRHFSYLLVSGRKSS